MLLSHTLGKKTKALLKIPLGSLSLGSLFSRIFHRHHHHHREEDEEDEDKDEDKEREHSPSERKAEDVFEDDLVAKQPDPREREREGKGKILADGSNLSHRILLVVTEEIEIEFDDRCCCCCCAKNMTMTAFFMRCSLSRF